MFTFLLKRVRCEFELIVSVTVAVITEQSRTPHSNQNMLNNRAKGECGTISPYLVLNIKMMTMSQLVKVFFNSKFVSRIVSFYIQTRFFYHQ